VNKTYTSEQLTRRLEKAFDVEFTFHKVDKLVDILAPLDRDTQDFILGWVERLASTNIQISYEFTCRVVEALDRLDRRVIEAWAVHAMDTYDRVGLRPALEVLFKVDDFLGHAHAHAEGAFFDEVKSVLSTFLCGLSGRRLKLEQGDQVHTDSERIFLPNVTARMNCQADNFLLCKAQVAYMWAQTRFGSFRLDFDEALAHWIRCGWKDTSHASFPACGATCSDCPASMATSRWQLSGRNSPASLTNPRMRCAC
jgi:nitric oxide reductase NorD protein